MNDRRTSDEKRSDLEQFEQQKKIGRDYYKEFFGWRMGNATFYFIFTIGIILIGIIGSFVACGTN